MKVPYVLLKHGCKYKETIYNKNCPNRWQHDLSSMFCRQRFVVNVCVIKTFWIFSASIVDWEEHKVCSWPWINQPPLHFSAANESGSVLAYKDFLRWLYIFIFMCNSAHFLHSWNLLFCIVENLLKLKIQYSKVVNSFKKSIKFLNLLSAQPLKIMRYFWKLSKSFLISPQKCCFKFWNSNLFCM